MPMEFNSTITYNHRERYNLPNDNTSFDQALIDSKRLHARINNKLLEREEIKHTKESVGCHCGIHSFVPRW